MIIKKFAKDVRGAALVYVIIAAAIIILLGAATTTTAYVNLRATQIQEKSDNNFYSADTIMNAIVSGLQNDVSIAYETAYTKVITNYYTYENSEKANKEFNTMFLNTLNILLNDSQESADDENFSFDFYYKIDHISEYVERVFGDNVNYTVSAVNSHNLLDVTDEGVILRNLHVTYEDDTGYYDEITTDIKIAIPEFGYEAPPFIEFDMNAIVIDDGLEIGIDRGDGDITIATGLQIVGNVYINERESDNNAVLLGDQTALTIISPDESILGGEIETKENTQLTIKGKDGNPKDGNLIWTENFNLGRYTTANIVGQIFVYDDMEINGSYSDVRLAGEYYGYSKSNTDVGESSAINVNGAHTTLDIAELDMLVLAGSSYIATSEVDPGEDSDYNNSTNIQTGESLSVKSNQIAYLVDDKEFSANDINDFVSNPMSYTQYDTLCSSNTNWDTVVEKLVTKTLSYGKSYKEYGATVIPVFSSKDNGTVYLYLSFDDPDNAATFFTDAYKGNSLLSQKLRTYAAQYITSLRLNTNASLLVNENYIDQSVDLYTNEDIPLTGFGYEQNNPNQGTIDDILEQIKTKYLGTTASDNANESNGDASGENVTESAVGEKYKVSYSKLVDNDQLKAFISNATASTTRVDQHTNNDITPIENGIIMTGTSGAKAILVDNAGKEAYRLEGGRGLVVVSGDLEIAGDWLGTIIVGGRAYCVEGSQLAPLDITVDKITVDSVLPLYFTMISNDVQSSMSVVNIFKGYTNVGVNNATNNEGISADMISNCITFTNWNRY